MHSADHAELACTLNDCKSKVVLSGYPSELYAHLYRSWYRVVFDMPNHSSGGRKKSRRQEVLWLNWRPEDMTCGRKQVELTLE